MNKEKMKNYCAHRICIHLVENWKKCKAVFCEKIAKRKCSFD